MRARRLIPTPSMGVALLALLIALGGTTYAALKLPASSVGTRQLKPGAVTTGRLHRGAVTGSRIAKSAVTGAKVKDHSLTAADLAAGTLSSGPAGPAGASGTALAYAHVDDFGQLVPNQFRNISNANIAAGDGGGTFCISGLPFTPHNAVVNADSEDAGFIATVDVPHTAAGATGCPASTQIEVTLFTFTLDTAPTKLIRTQAKGGFYIAIN